MLEKRSIAEGRVVEFHLLSADWLERGYLDVLSQLSPCDLSCAQAKRILLAQMQQNAHGLIPVAGVFAEPGSTQLRQVMACGTLLVEQKFIHGGGKVGHIEDVVVDRRFRGLGAGRALVEVLLELAKALGCYKAVLSCREGAESFYERCGFRRFEIEMRRDFAT